MSVLQTIQLSPDMSLKEWGYGCGGSQSADPGQWQQHHQSLVGNANSESGSLEMGPRDLCLSEPSRWSWEPPGPWMLGWWLCCWCCGWWCSGVATTSTPGTPPPTDCRVEVRKAGPTARQRWPSPQHLAPVGICWDRCCNYLGVWFSLLPTPTFFTPLRMWVPKVLSEKLPASTFPSHSLLPGLTPGRKQYQVLS